MHIGIDLGGTKTEIIALNDTNGKELYRQRLPTPRDSYQATLDMLTGMVNQAEQALGQKGTVGLGIPGNICEKTNLVRGANSTQLNGNPLRADLMAVLGRDVRVENDANCFTVSEAVDGAAAGKHFVFGVIIGTGCGGGIAVGGKAHKGVNGLSGEWGHTPLSYPRVLGSPPTTSFETADTKPRPITYFTDDPAWSEYPGPLCYCGRHACKEVYISGTGLRRDYLRVNGEEKSTHDIIAAAKTGDKKSAAALERYTHRLARSLAEIINIMDPDAIVLGGGMSNVDSLYQDVPKIWNDYIFTGKADTPLLPPRHGDSSGVRGAAWLWNNG